MNLTIRPLIAADQTEWRALWTAYLEFYNAAVPDAVYDATFKRLRDPKVPEMFARLAVLDDVPVGLVHAIQHRHCWRIEDVIYLQDLFVAPRIRGTGAGRALTEAVYREADARGCPSVYWMTQDFNIDARKLYDRIATLTPFIKYQR
jgi:GNAT superfamily N-acetyltransferase